MMMGTAKKENTFFDFIDAGKFLINQNYTDEEHLFCYGGSAGGLLIGAVINIEPDMWKGAIASVPFVDVVTTGLIQQYRSQHMSGWNGVIQEKKNTMNICYHILHMIRLVIKNILIYW